MLTTNLVCVAILLSFLHIHCPRYKFFNFLPSLTLYHAVPTSSDPGEMSFENMAGKGENAGRRKCWKPAFF